jgi:hypothetical protein
MYGDDPEKAAQLLAEDDDLDPEDDDDEIEVGTDDNGGMNFMMGDYSGVMDLRRDLHRDGGDAVSASHSLFLSANQRLDMNAFSAATQGLDYSTGSTNHRHDKKSTSPFCSNLFPSSVPSSLPSSSATVSRGFGMTGEVAETNQRGESRNSTNQRRESKHPTNHLRETETGLNLSRSVAAAAAAEASMHHALFSQASRESFEGPFTPHMAFATAAEKLRILQRASQISAMTRDHKVDDDDDEDDEIDMENDDVDVSMDADVTSSCDGHVTGSEKNDSKQDGGSMSSAKKKDRNGNDADTSCADDNCDESSDDTVEVN